MTVRTFDFGSDRTISDAYQGPQSSKLGLRGIRNSLRNPRQFETQICALLRAAAHGPLRVMFPMVTNLEDWDEAMRKRLPAAPIQYPPARSSWPEAQTAHHPLSGWAGR